MNRKDGMTNTPYLSIGDFKFNPSKAFWKKLAKRHEIQDVAGLQKSLRGVLISAIDGRTQTKYTHRKAIRTTESMLRALRRFKELCDNDIYLTNSLTWKDTDEKGQLGDERSALASSLQKMETRLIDTHARLKGNAFVSALINQGPGRPSSAKRMWLWQLWVIFCDHSKQRGLVNRGNSEVGEYSGDFYEFTSALCKEAKISIGDHDLATSIQRVIEKNISQKSG